MVGSSDARDSPVIDGLKITYYHFKVLFLSPDDAPLYTLTQAEKVLGPGWGPVDSLYATDEAKMRAALIDLLRAGLVEIYRYDLKRRLTLDEAEAAANDPDLWRPRFESPDRPHAMNYVLAHTDAGAEVYNQVFSYYLSEDPREPPLRGPES